MEDSALAGQFHSKLAEPATAAEQLEALMGYQRKFVYESDTSLTGYPTNVKLPVTVSHLGVVPSSERPAKQSKPNNSWDSSFHGQQQFSSKVSTPPSIYVPSSGLKHQHQQFQNHFTNFFKLNGSESYGNVPRIEEEIVAYGGHAQRSISDVTRSDVDAAFNVSSGQLVRPNHVALDMRTTDVTAGDRNRQSNKVPNKASVNSQCHIMAERKRREKLSQKFIAPSAIVPGLKKMDKTSRFTPTIQ